MQIAKRYSIAAMIVEKNFPILHCVVFESTQQHSGLLSNSALADCIEPKSKKTLKRIKDKVCKKSMQPVSVSGHSRSWFVKTN